MTDEPTDDLRRRRLGVIDEHFRSEIDHDWETCLGTFGRGVLLIPPSR